ncbi:MAG: AAA family ATPase [Alphaproteobacteria bacterium]|nr:AAA family ATPase [Alphaproteobacteria bacterium]
MGDEKTGDEKKGSAFPWARNLDSAFPFRKGRTAIPDDEPTEGTNDPRPDGAPSPPHVSGARPADPETLRTGPTSISALLSGGRKRRPVEDETDGVRPAGEDEEESSSAEAVGSWPSADDRLSAIRKLMPRTPSMDDVPLPIEDKAALPEPPPEPKRGTRSRLGLGSSAEGSLRRGRFRPNEPSDLDAAGLPDGLVEALVVKHLYNSPGASGRALAYDVGLRNTIVVRILEDLKMRRLAIHRAAAAMGDFYYELTEEGRDLARGLNKDSRYAGPAPVPLVQYVESVKKQAISTEKPKLPQLRGAFSDMKVPDSLLNRIGPAVTHGKGMFMYGPPGNGKTSLAERITRAYGQTVYIPHAIYAGGHIIQVFDPAVHVPVDESDIQATSANDKIDRRWVRCRRPTVLVGGELTMDALDIAFDEVDGICEAPIQIKANCGTLVIDDFGRQRMPPDELLNRWIVPLEKQVDYIALPGGRKEAFPFECLLVFSTNMEPRDLVDEAFLRRIPYKLEVGDPDDDTFMELLEQICAKLGLEVVDDSLQYLLQHHFKATGRNMRFCHPRDLMLQVLNLCRFREEPLVVDRHKVDEAVLMYFSLL